MKSIYNVPLVRTQETTALTNIGQLLDVQVTGVQNNDILVYEAPKWKNKPQVLNNNADVTITAPIINQYLGHTGTEWVNKEIALNDLSDVALTSLSTNQVLQWDGDYWSNYTLPSPNAFANLSDVQITGVQNNDSIIYNSATSKYVNKKKYAEFDNYVQLSNTTITAVARTVYFCNLAIINLPPSTLGEQIKIINTNGPACTVAFPGIIYHLVNNFNTLYSTTDACCMTLEGIIGGNWQIVNFTGKWLNLMTGKYLVNNSLDDLRNVSIAIPSANQALLYNGTNWINSAISYNNLTNLPTFPTGKIFLQSAGNLSNNQYIGNYGQSANYLSNMSVAPHTLTIVAFTVFISVNTTAGTRTFTLFKNQVTTGIAIVFTNLTGLFARVTCNINCVLGNTFSIFHQNAGSPNASGCVTIEYN